MINIALITDNNYVNPTLLTISSIIANKNEDSVYNIHLVTNGLTEENKNKFNKLRTNNINVDIIDASNLIEPFKSIITTRHVTYTAVLKFHLADIFKECDKLLYLDGDVLVQADLNELFQIDLTGKYGAVVKDTHGKKWAKRVNKKLSFYFNSGVMLLNLKYMRENNTTEKLIKYKMDNIHMPFMDQDAFNYVFDENIYSMSYRWNTIMDSRNIMKPKDIEYFYQEPVEEDEREFFKNSKIIHMASKYKPWMYKSGYLSELCKKYWELSVIEEDFPELIDKPEKSKPKLSFWQKLFSVRNDNNDVYKIITICFISFKIRR